MLVEDEVTEEEEEEEGGEEVEEGEEEDVHGADARPQASCTAEEACRLCGVPLGLGVP